MTQPSATTASGRMLVAMAAPAVSSYAPGTGITAKFSGTPPRA